MTSVDRAPPRNIVVESSRVALENHRAPPSILDAAWNNSTFFEKFDAELDEIERMNKRFEEDISQKVQQRVDTYGEDGKRILGIDVQVDLLSPRSLPPFPKNPYAADFRRERELESAAAEEVPEEVAEESQQNEGPSMFLTDIQDDGPVLPRKSRDSPKSQIKSSELQTKERQVVGTRAQGKRARIQPSD